MDSPSLGSSVLSLSPFHVLRMRPQLNSAEQRANPLPPSWIVDPTSHRRRFWANKDVNDGDSKRASILPCPNPLDERKGRRRNGNMFICERVSCCVTRFQVANVFFGPKNSECIFQQHATFKQFIQLHNFFRELHALIIKYGTSGWFFIYVLIFMWKFS